MVIAGIIIEKKKSSHVVQLWLQQNWTGQQEKKGTAFLFLFCKVSPPTLPSTHIPTTKAVFGISIWHAVFASTWWPVVCLEVMDKVQFGVAIKFIKMQIALPFPFHSVVACSWNKLEHVLER